MIPDSADTTPVKQDWQNPVASKKDVRAVVTPQRFLPSRTTLLVDRFMTHFIKVGGFLIIAAVLGILVFITWQALPLFRRAEVTYLKSIPLPVRDYRAIGTDEWSERPFLLDAEGKFTFVDVLGKTGVQDVVPGFAEKKTFTAFRYNPQRQDAVLGTNDGHFTIVKVIYQSSFEGGARSVGYEVSASPFYKIGKENHPIVDIDYGGQDSKLVVAIQEVNGLRELHALPLTQSQGLLGPGEITAGQPRDLTSSISGQPQSVCVNVQGTDFLITNEEGVVFYFNQSGDAINLLQDFKPFADSQKMSITLMRFLLGGVSAVLSNEEGKIRIYSLSYAEGGDIRIFNLLHSFDQLPGGATFYDYSLRNKAFLVGDRSFASLRFSTTEEVRWEASLPFAVRHAALGGKYNSLLFAGTDSKLHVYHLNDPHPESSFKSLFGKLAYEGSLQPKYEWQSTGATDDFEPKLSLVPLVIGTLKGTFYAMIFAVPIAMLAAVYTSQFLHPAFRIFVKPTMEIMASLPSVVLGFLAALWLAPILETRIPSIILMLIFLPLSAVAVGFIWNSLPIRYRVFVKPGFEWLVFLPLALLVALICWHAGPAFEKAAFVVNDPSTGKLVADFRLWWPEVTGLPFEQRNSLVVGFMMGFAVIPIIFTIAEDAMSNVPGALRSASLALGASRWQTAMRVIVPTASAGIFSAIMIGLGRAVGETMIVVMATGNTPVLDFNIFSGMRTLSANIAVELPEAPHHGTLYRTLFLGGMLLFLMTFLVNTLAEILRQHLREKYKTI